VGLDKEEFTVLAVFLSHYDITYYKFSNDPRFLTILDNTSQKNTVFGKMFYLVLSINLIKRVCVLYHF
jgi:hypothetical protein